MEGETVPLFESTETKTPVTIIGWVGDHNWLLS